jgi:hypothetical protein
VLKEKKFSKLLSVLSILALTMGGISAISLPANAAGTKSVVISGFASNSSALSKSMKKNIKKFIRDNSEFSNIRCVGYADREGTAGTNKVLGKNRAASTCEHALKFNPELEVKTKGRWDSNLAGSNIRRVKITLSQSVAQITTFFEYAGGEEGPKSASSKAGESITLPAPNRAGYQLLGWFTKQYNGTKVGNGGDTYTPTKTRILWAQWFSPTVSSSTCSTPFEGSFAEDLVDPFPTAGYMWVEDGLAEQLVATAESPDLFVPVAEGEPLGVGFFFGLLFYGLEPNEAEQFIDCLLVRVHLASSNSIQYSISGQEIMDAVGAFIELDEDGAEDGWDDLTPEEQLSVLKGFFWASPVAAGANIVGPWYLTLNWGGVEKKRITLEKGAPEPEPELEPEPDPVEE